MSTAGFEPATPSSERDRQQVPWHEDIHDERLEGWAETTAANMLDSRKLKVRIIQGRTVYYKNMLRGSAASVRGWLVMMLPALSLRALLLYSRGSYGFCVFRHLLQGGSCF